MHTEKGPILPRPRRTRRAATKGATQQRAIVAAIAVIALVAVCGFALRGMWSDRAEARDDASVEATSLASSLTTSTAHSVEVPDVVGASYKEAVVVLEAAGLVPTSATGEQHADTAAVTSQEPAAGQLVEAGARVSLHLGASAQVLTATQAKSASPGGVGGQFVVVIDPGHQGRGNSKLEPVGPGSKETKVSVSGGTTGRVTRLPEYEIALQISMNLKARLEAAGVKVVMTRTTNDVNISNSARAEIANDAGANLFVRIHCDGNPDPSMTGISTLYPGGNNWVKPISAESKAAAGLIQQNVVSTTGAVDRGLSERADQTGFNFAKMPSVLVECGFMSNEVEDRLLCSPHYQDKLAEGIAQGILAFYQSR